MKLMLLGAPGTGKGTQSEFLVKEYGIPVISTGAIIREALLKDGPAAHKMKTYMEKGELVPDSIVIEMVNDRLSWGDCHNGFILDGFPRTVPQAQALSEMGIELDFVINIMLPEEVILERMGGRRFCPKCSATYHEQINPPKVEGICNACGEALGIRDDDKEETMKNRLRVYNEQTMPLLEYYRKKKELVSVSGEKSIKEVTFDIMKALRGQP